MTVEVDAGVTQGAIRDLLGANRRPTFDSQPPGTSYDASSLYTAFALSQVRTHDTGVDLCSTYTAATKLNAGVSPPTAVSGCTLSGTSGPPHFAWTPTSSLDADLDNPDNYDFSSVDAAISKAIATGARIYLRLGESYNGPNDTSDPVAWAKVATNIYRHVLGIFKPTPGIAVDPVFVEIHNEPDGAFWAGGASTFHALYRETADRVRAAATAAGRSVKVGGAGFTANILTTSQRSGNPAKGFVTAVGASRLDFYSAHHYNTCSTATLQETASFLRSLRALVDADGGAGKPLHLTEWNIGLGERCGQSFFGTQQNQSFASGALTLMQDPAQNVEAAHFYAAVPIMPLFDFTAAAGTVRVNPSAWAFWAHGKQRGATAISAKVCPSGGSCVAGYAAESTPLLAIASQSGGRQTIVVTNDGTAAVAYTLRMKGLAASSVRVTASNPPQGSQAVSVGGSPVAAGAGEIAALFAKVTADVRDGLAVAGGQVEVELNIPARSVQVVDVEQPATRLSNIATRGPVFTGDSVMIGGFIIQGTAPKKVLVTARGPSMAAQGVAGTLADPFLTLYSGATPIASNDDFGSAPNASEIPASMKPGNAKEAAILTTLNPGAYTAIVTGVGGTTGIAIVEAFEVDKPESPLANIATRAPVLTGDNVMIGGFIISGDSPRTVLVTARGPSLAAQGVPGTLADPVLTLYSGQAVIASNDDWGTNANAAAIQATGQGPSVAKEAALLVTLNPGAYTAIVTGAGGSTGIGIVEVFAQ